MAQLDPNPIPAYAVTMWASDREIFVAMPMAKGGVPYIVSFPLHEGGLSQALDILRKRPRETLLPTAAQPANYTKPVVQAQVRTSKAHERLVAETTPEQRDAAQALLRKLGMLK